MADLMQNARTSTGGRVPDLSGDIRHLIPKLGLRNYWYPALPVKRVPTGRPVKLSLLGEDVVLFRGKEGTVAALTDICPHRGARLSEGHAHWPGTVACPYHGWVFDETGKNVAVLSEGPESKVCGKPGTEARKYPTRVLKGMVFIWVGDEAAAPIEEDVPEEFFDPKSLILFGVSYWNCNWEVALENSMDAHVNYLHRNALVVLRGEYYARGAVGTWPVFVGNGFAGDVTQGFDFMPKESNTYQDVYANGWTWPKSRWRRWWTWAFKWNVDGAQRNVPSPKTARWSGGHHLPGMYRTEFAYDLYTRMVVAVEAKKSRLIYYHTTYPKNAWQALVQRVLYYGYHRWLIEQNFSMQDNSVMNNQRYDSPEFLSRTDAEVVQWRRFIVTKAFGGRSAPYHFRNPYGADPDNVPMELLSSERFMAARKQGTWPPANAVAEEPADTPTPAG